MAIKNSGVLSMLDIVAEFKGNAPHSLGEYYRGGTLVPNDSTINIPQSGPISYDDFYGAENSFQIIIRENQADLDLIQYAIDQGWSEQSILKVSILEDVYVYSTTTSNGGLIITPTPKRIEITNAGIIMGMGGRGGNFNTQGGAGGPAIKSDADYIYIANTTTGWIVGGGGGGGGGSQSGAGGGAGGGIGGNSSEPRTGGAGGLPGASGVNGTGGSAEGKGGQAGAAGGGVQENKGADTAGSGGGGGRVVPGTSVNAPIPVGNLPDWPGGYGGGANNPGGAYGYPYAHTTTQGGSGRSAMAAGGGGGWGQPGGAGTKPAGSGGRAVQTTGTAFVGLNNGTIYGGYL